MSEVVDKVLVGTSHILHLSSSSSPPPLLSSFQELVGPAPAPSSHTGWFIHRLLDIVDQELGDTGDRWGVWWLDSVTVLSS